MFWTYRLLFLLLLLHFVSCGLLKTLSTRDTGSLDSCHELQVSIIVSSLIEASTPRLLVLSWENVTPDNESWIGLFDVEPTSGSIKKPLHVIVPKRQSGWEKTNFYEVAISSNDLGYSKKCLSYWVALVSADNSTILASSCLHTEPTWMSDMKTQLSPLLLKQIFFPGTHDSGSYNPYNPTLGETLVSKYTITQEEDILSQLIYGVRYLDIRAAYYESTDEKWWLNHGVARIHPMQTVIDAVLSFIQNTNEIVILDFHEFPVGFDSGLDIHKMFVEYLVGELGQFAASPSLTWNTKLGDIWSAGKQLILSYNKNDMLTQNNLLWPAVSQQWGNVQTLDDLYTYLSGVMTSPPTNKGWAAMAELTPTTWQVITDELGGLRRMAEMVNKNVTEWFRGIWGQTVNIVAPDFFRGTGIVDSAIRWNKLHAQGVRCSAKRK